MWFQRNLPDYSEYFFLIHKSLIHLRFYIFLQSSQLHDACLNIIRCLKASLNTIPNSVSFILYDS